MANMFEWCDKLTNLDLGSFNTSILANTSYMFSRCTSLRTINLSKAVFTKVTNSSDMFDGTSNLTVKVKDEAAKTFLTSKLGSHGTAVIA